MKSWHIFFLGIFLVMAACQKAVDESQELPANTPALPESKPTTEAQATTVPDDEAAPAEPTLTLSPDVEKAAAASMRDIERVSVYPSFKKLVYGQNHIFALGIANRINKEDTFRIQVKYKSAKDKNQGSLSEDNDFASSWISADTFKEDILSNGQKTFVPVMITVGKVSTGAIPPNGSYTFEIEVLNRGGSTIGWNTYGKGDIVVSVVG